MDLDPHCTVQIAMLVQRTDNLLAKELLSYTVVQVTKLGSTFHNNNVTKAPQVERTYLVYPNLWCISVHHFQNMKQMIMFISKKYCYISHDAIEHRGGKNQLKCDVH